MTKWSLVGDVGGTNARFALVRDSEVALQYIEVLACKDFDNLDGAVAAYLSKQNVEVSEACIAFACPVHGAEIKMTNNHWSFDKETMQQRLGLKTFKCLNDFTAMALGMPLLAGNDLMLNGGNAKAAPDKPRLVIGPGTGLGVSALVWHSGQWLPLSTEGGHVNWAPVDEWEMSLWQWLREKHERISAERLLSGAGLLLLYQGYCALRGLPERCEKPADVTDRAIKERDELCLEVLSHFCRILGGVSGDAALTLGALGGVYICGGIVPRFPELFVQSGFRAQFEAKGRLSSYMKDIPVWLVRAEYPGLMGSAAGLFNDAV
ncbi:glucokinase [Pokkaliibacter sp. CJK22405]|uniref:glucokinase n=1 Tax=Pokkaliibacter sp. CJK22405 TaxID=3384615 RepID=UPI0039851555